MDRSHRAEYVRCFAASLLALTLAVGCNRQTPAPAAAPTVTGAHSALIERLSASHPAALLPDENEHAVAAPVATPVESEAAGEVAMATEPEGKASDDTPATTTSTPPLIDPEKITADVAAVEAATSELSPPVIALGHKSFSISEEDSAKGQQTESTEIAPTATQEKVATAPVVAPAAKETAAPVVETPTPAVAKKTEVAVTVPARDEKQASPKDTTMVAKILEQPSDAESILPWGPSAETPEMRAVIRRAEETVQRGFDLAEHGALYTARAQFIDALRTMAQAMDGQRNSTAHTKALAAGLRAMEEVDDFVPRGTRLDTDLNLKMIVDAHRTPVLKEHSLDGVTAIAAQRRYLTYAQEQLAAAAGDQAVSSLALHGLGKICVAPAAMHGPREQMAEAKAVVFYQVAMTVDSRNFISANELGVLLAKFGHLEEAKTVLEQAATASNSPTSWQNLAVVYQRLGDAPKAEQARAQGVTAAAQWQQAGYSTAGMKYPINWIDPAAFAQTSTMVGNNQPVAAAKQEPTPAKTAARPEKPGSGFPWPWK